MTNKSKVLQDYMKLPYTIILRKDEEGDVIARVKEFEGCVADGQDEIEALGERSAIQRRDHANDSAIIGGLQASAYSSPKTRIALVSSPGKKGFQGDDDSSVEFAARQIPNAVTTTFGRTHLGNVSGY